MGREHPIEIALATANDVPQLVGLLQELFEQEADFSPEPERQLRALNQLLASPARSRVLLAKRDGLGVGMVTLIETVSTAEGGPAVWLEDLVVTREFRREGIGSKLLTAAIADCRARQITRVTLLTDRDNEPAKQFYRRHGFVASAMTPMRRYLSPEELSP